MVKKYNARSSGYAKAYDHWSTFSARPGTITWYTARPHTMDVPKWTYSVPARYRDRWSKWWKDPYFNRYEGQKAMFLAHAGKEHAHKVDARLWGFYRKHLTDPPVATAQHPTVRPDVDSMYYPAAGSQRRTPEEIAEKKRRAQIRLRNYKDALYKKKMYEWDLKSKFYFANKKGYYSYSTKTNKVLKPHPHYGLVALKR